MTSRADSRHYEPPSDGGGNRWAIVCSLIETCKLNGVEPYAYLTDVLTRMVDGHPVNRLDELLPWVWKPDDRRATDGRLRALKVNSQLRYFANLRACANSFLSALAAGRVRTSTRTLFAFSRRGPCVPSRSAQGRRMLFIRFVNRAVQAVWRSHHEGRKQARDSGHSLFRGPARGRSPRTRISLSAPFQRTGSSTDSR